MKRYLYQILSYRQRLEKKGKGEKKIDTRVFISSDQKTAKIPNCSVFKLICGIATVDSLPENRMADFFISSPENKSNIPTFWFSDYSNRPIINIVEKKNEDPKWGLVASRRFFVIIMFWFYGALKITHLNAIIFKKKKKHVHCSFNKQLNTSIYTV